MDDIEEVIDASRHFKYHEPLSTVSLNRISSLPESKEHLKRAIKERIRLLKEAYVSLATFIDDDIIDFLEDPQDKEEIKKASIIYQGVLRDMDRLRVEIERFDSFELST